MSKARMKVSLDMRELHRKVAALTPAVRREVLEGGALEKAAAPIEAAAKQGVPKLSGGLADSITIARVPAETKSGAAVAVGHNKPGGSHAHLVELGTDPRYHKDGKFVGQMPAQPYLRPAFDQKKGEAVRIARRAIGAALRAAGG
jgi:HK97 gp10 family phage protein